MKQINKIMLLFLFGFAVLAQTAAQAQVPGDSWLTTRYSSRIAISPYAQAAPNDSYTFIGVSHPSLDSALTQIGVVVEVIGMNTTVNTAAGRATIFTIDAGETHRVFVANQSHADINTTNTSFSDARTHIIPTVDSPQFGAVRVTAVSERSGSNNVKTGVPLTLQNGARKFDGVAQLSIWGIVYTQASGTGFAMEFIGDMQDSSVQGSLNTDVRSTMNACGHGSGTAGCKDIPAGTVGTSGTVTQPRPGRGIN